MVSLFNCSVSRFHKVLAFVLTVVSGLSMNAAHEKGSSRLNLSSYTTSNNTLLLKDNKYNTVSTNVANPSAMGFFDHTYKNKIIFGIDRTITSLGNITAQLTSSKVFRAEIDVQINYNSYLPANLAFTSGSIVKTLTVSFSGFNSHTNASAPVTETDLDVITFDRAYLTFVKINAVRIYDSYTSTTALVTTNIPNNLYVETQYDAERYYDLNTSAASPFVNSADFTSQYVTGSSTGNEIILKWRRISGAEEYDIEWLWLDEHTYGNGGSNPMNASWSNSPLLDFKNNSTRVRTSQNTYSISNIYESGHLFFRIRGVGRAKTPGALTALGNSPISEIYTNWTSPDIYSFPSANDPIAMTGSGGGTSGQPFYIDLRSYAHEENKNWTYISTYAEEGKKKEVVTYFDGAQYNRQTVTKNNSDHFAVVGETYYDYIGRATINALPTPVDDATIKFYQQTVGTETGFNFDNTGKAYNKEVFAPLSTPALCNSDAPGFSKSYGTGKYYSTNNPFQNLNYNTGYTPNSENAAASGQTYPFTQSEYVSDMTGKMARQGGVGEAFKINHSTSDKHDTRYLYGSVSQEELDRLFGSEAGYASRYTKNVVIDANGQVSISYLNQEGKVVATALGGSKPANLDPLYAVNGTTDLSAQSTPIDVDLLNKANPNNTNTATDNNIIEGDALVFTDKIVVTSPQNYLFNYTALGSCYQACTGDVYGSLCYDCVYDLEFDIRDKCGNQPTGFTPITYTLGKIVGTPPSHTNPTPNLDATGGNDNVNFSFSQIIPVGNSSLSVNFTEIGEYTILKKLTVNKQAMEWYLNDYLSKCPATAAQYASNESVNLNISGCELDCKECVEKLGGQPAFTANLMSQNPGMTQTQADAQYNELVKECTEPCQYDSYCETAKEAMFSDLSPGGQYAQFNGNGSTFDAAPYPVSVFNANSNLPRRTYGTAPWKTPKYYLNTSVLDYVDENGNPDKVTVQLVSPGVYNPPLDPSAPVTAGPGINQYLVSPKYLANGSDFAANFKPSWAKSLLMFHPEYPYIDWCMKNSAPVSGMGNISVTMKNYNSAGTQTGTTAYLIPPSSDNYDSLLVAIDDIDDIVSTTVLFSPLLNDPYWNTNGNGKYYIAPSALYNTTSLPESAGFNATSGTIFQMQNVSSATPYDFSASAPGNMYFDQAKNKTANNRFYNYKGSGLTLYQYAALMATPLAQQFGQNMSSLISQLLNTSNPATAYYTSSNAPSGPNDPNYILNIQKPGTTPSTDDSYKRKAWETYKTLYLALKKEMQDEAAQSYVMNGPLLTRGCNDCIGNPNFDENKVKYTTYGNTAALFLIPGTVTSFPWLNNSFNAMILTLKNWYHFFGPGSGSLHPNNEWQACGLATKDLYKNKVKRYYLTDEVAASAEGSAGNTQAAIYNQTGLCPNAYDLQSFLNDMDGNAAPLFTTNYSLTATSSAFSENLYKEILPVIPSPFYHALYDMTGTANSGQTLNGLIKIMNNNPTPGIAASGNITLSFPSTIPLGLPTSPSPSPIDWSNYTGSTPAYTISQFSGLQPTSGTGNFNVNAIISYYVSGNVVSSPIALTGTSPFNLTGCSFIPPCKANGTGKAVSALLNSMSANQKFPAPYNGSAYLTEPIYPSGVNTSYAYVFTNSFKSLLETPGNTSSGWEWNYNSGTKELIVQDGSSTTNKRLKIAFTFPSGYNEACIQTFQNFLPDVGTNSPGDFTAEAVVSNITQVGNCASGTTLIKGTVSVGTYAGGFWVYSPINVGTCSFDLASCNTPPHEVKKDMQTWATTSGSGFVSMLQTTGGLDISSNIYLTTLLRSYLTSQTTYNSSTQAPLQNYYYWLFDGANSSTDKIEGWLIVSQSSSAPSSPPAGSCKLVFKKVNNSTLNSIGTILASNLSGFLLNGPVSNSNYYSFKMASSLGTNDSVQVSTSCFPMRACGSCASPNTIINNTSNPGTITIEDFAGPTQDYVLTNSDFNYTFVSNQANNYNLQNQQAVHSDMKQVNLYSNTTGCSTGYPFNNSIYGLMFSPNSSNISSNGNISTLTKAFSVNTSGLYHITFTGIGIDQFFGKVNIYFNNNLVFTHVTTSPYGPPGLMVNGTNFPNNYHFPKNLTAGTTYVLKIEMIHSGNTCHPPTHVYPINAVFQIPADPQIPCVNTNAWPTDTMPTTNYEEPCAPYLQDIVDNTADEKYQAYIDSTKSIFIRNYKAHCMNSVVENLMMKYNNNDYHYTLYYYDQAGNLARTVPPEGVKPVNLNAIYAGSQTNGEAIKQDRDQYNNGSYVKKVYTQHKFLTTYTYNSLDQLVKQETPDAGVSKFYYDNLGRLVASQNAEQKNQSTVAGNHKYSYTKYDALGRISMVGTMGTSDLENYPNIPSGQGIRDILSATNYPFNMNIAANSHKEVTQTFYGDDPAFTAIIPASNFSNGYQDNLRGRVASVSIEDIYDGNNATYQHATHYSYDVHGNVKELINDNPNMGRFTNQRYKKVQYNYDLISGKVNSVVYQRGKRDMFVHSYYYDADNRITNVFTSRDSITWDQDAKYYYYLHGPLARVELGQHKVQGLDYAYTLQGWIKGVNSEALTYKNDMGKDGYQSLTGASNAYDKHRFNARDGFGYAITYFDVASSYRDYNPVNNAQSSAPLYFLSTANLSTVPDLFNGNIKGLSASYLNPNPGSTSIPGIATNINEYQPYSFQRGFKYDQLNRITDAKVIGRNVDGSNNWVNASNTTNEFYETFKYDQNGNITTLTRKSNTGNMDGLTYYYYDNQGTAYNPQTTTPSNPPTNKLAYVTDAYGSPTGSDIGNQGSGNYTYDKIGNLTADASENISSIGWTVYGKIKNIIRNTTAKPNMYFTYDAMGNRVSKKVLNSNGSFTETHYVRDAQGNVMAVYEDNATNSGSLVETLSLKELDVYGSNRVGMANTNDQLGALTNNVNQVFTASQALVNSRTLGNKSYELGNHLGNVIATISDRLLPVDANTDNIMDNFVPDMLSTSDYYAFGSPMPGRNYTSAGYRYGFNGKENDDEVKGDGNHLDFGDRGYDPRLGRWMSIDWKVNKYPHITPYGFALNNPLFFVDIDGNDIGVTVTKVSKSNGQVSVSGEITIRMKVVNLSNRTMSPKEMKTYTDGIKASGAGLFSGQGDITVNEQGKDKKWSKTTISYDIKVKVEIEEVSSLDKLGKDDHVLMIVDQIKPQMIDGKMIDPVGLTSPPMEGLRVMAVEAATFDNKDQTALHVTMHEIGHAFGLGHSDRPGNLMYGSGGSSFGITSEQIADIALSNGLNQKSKISKTIDWSKNNTHAKDDAKKHINTRKIEIRK